MAKETKKEVQETENKAGVVENATPAKNGKVQVVVLTPFFDGERHEIGEILEVEPDYFKELFEKKLIAKKAE